MCSAVVWAKVSFVPGEIVQYNDGQNRDLGTTQPMSLFNITTMLRRKALFFSIQQMRNGRDPSMSMIWISLFISSPASFYTSPILLFFNLDFYNFLCPTPKKRLCVCWVITQSPLNSPKRSLLLKSQLDCELECLLKTHTHVTRVQRQD